jgi:dihydroorotate dehydrogenase
MPDWSYRTVCRPLFFRLPPRLARGLCLGVVGTLARLPLGGKLIDLLGHMQPDPRLRRDVLGIAFASPVGLGAGLDVDAIALRALARFGFGLMEVGPVLREPIPTRDVERRAMRQALWLPEPPPNIGLAKLQRALERAGPLPLPVMARLAVRPGTAPERATDDCRALVAALAPHVRLFALATLARAAAEGWPSDRWREHLHAVRLAAAPVALVLVVPPDLDETKADELIEPLLTGGPGGVVVASGVAAEEGGRLLGLPAREAHERQVRRLRRRWGQQLALISSGSVHEPEQGLRLIEGGADLVLIESGLVYGGPGLPKRINEALLYAYPPPQPLTPEYRNGRPAVRAPQQTWFWTTLLGAGMALGSALALAIAATRVVLPYDEGFVGMSREQLEGINPRLLAFMTHDRVSLAGTMVAIGVLYLQLSLFGVRRGRHWAAVAIFISAFSGFATFFLFLGFGYFDPFHAFVTAVLLQFLLLALHSDLPPPAPLPPPNLRDDRRWRLGQWGQLLFVIHGAALIVAGLMISAIGCTEVFVPEDLEFMGTTAEALHRANPRLVPLVAHDRATFGGMLLSSGLLLLLSSLWGFHQGARWFWWALLTSSLPAYGAAIAVHLAVGYTNVMHLAPAFAGLALFSAALALSFPYLCAGENAAREWRDRPRANV